MKKRICAQYSKVVPHTKKSKAFEKWLNKRAQMLYWINSVVVVKDFFFPFSFFNILEQQQQQFIRQGSVCVIRQAQVRWSRLVQQKKPHPISSPGRVMGLLIVLDHVGQFRGVRLWICLVPVDKKKKDITWIQSEFDFPDTQTTLPWNFQVGKKKPHNHLANLK